MTLEAAFAIGRPARSSAYKTCTRCKGTGWWQLARLCFKCGGVGHAEVSTLATKIRDKQAHIAEVREMITSDEAFLATATKRWTRIGPEAHLASNKANLAKLEAELVVLLAKVPS